MSAEGARRAADLLREHRESIDRLDAILVYTLAERFSHTQAIGRLKAEHDLPPSDPAREAHQIARLEKLAHDADLDPVFAKKFLTFIISEVIRHHERHLEDTSAGGGTESANHATLKTPSHGTSTQGD